MRHVSLDGLSLLTGVLLEQSLVVFNQLDALTYPSHDRNRHRITERLVAWTIRRVLLPLPRNIRPSVRETLKPFAFQRRQPANRQTIHRILRMQKLVIVRAERGRKLVLPEESLTPPLRHRES